MPFSSVDELDQTIRDSMPVGAQKIFLAAFNASFERDKDEGKASKVARSAVKKAGFIQNEETGKFSKVKTNNSKFNFTIPEMDSKFITIPNVTITKQGVTTATSGDGRVHNCFKSNEEIDKIKMDSVVPLWIDHYNPSDPSSRNKRTFIGFADNKNIAVSDGNKQCDLDFHIFDHYPNTIDCMRKNILNDVSIEFIPVERAEDGVFNSISYDLVESDLFIYGVAILETQTPAASRTDGVGIPAESGEILPPDMVFNKKAETEENSMTDETQPEIKEEELVETEMKEPTTESEVVEEPTAPTQETEEPKIESNGLTPEDVKALFEEWKTKEQQEYEKKLSVLEGSITSKDEELVQLNTKIAEMQGPFDEMIQMKQNQRAERIGNILKQTEKFNATDLESFSDEQVKVLEEVIATEKHNKASDAAYGQVNPEPPADRTETMQEKQNRLDTEMNERLSNKLNKKGD